MRTPAPQPMNIPIKLDTSEEVSATFVLPALITYDYSEQELRIFAAMCDDDRDDINERFAALDRK